MSRILGRFRDYTFALQGALLLSLLIACAAASAMAFTGVGDDSQSLLTVDHYVRLRSSVPAMSGQPVQIYVRERTKASLLREPNLTGRVVLFVHGGGTPGEVAFDVPYSDYSWMAFLADAGFDVFSMDFTGYGRSTRSWVMNDPCNLAPEEQTALSPIVPATPCDPSYKGQLNPISAEWDELNAVVDYLRALRRVDQVSIVAWSRGGPRSGGFVAQHPDKVSRLVLLAPAYTRNAPIGPPAGFPAPGVAMTKQSREDFIADWNGQVGCPAQYEAAVSNAIWSEMLASDPVGATWGPGVRRAPSTTQWGWNSAVAARTQTPTLVIAGAHDKQVLPERVRNLYEDLGSKQKVFVDLGCSSHNAMWESNHLLLFRASLEWLARGTVNGMKDGVIRLGY